jgi:GNAT superfamily N-acetyltransferase
MPEYEITLARTADVPLLPAIELAAETLFAGHGLDFVASVTTNFADFIEAQQCGLLWVALADNVPVGFAHVKVLESMVAHLEEIDVHPEHGRMGLGTRLVKEICQWAAGAGYRSVTLTTFRDIPWNMPFYARLGFEEIPPQELSNALLAVIEDEARRGLDPTLRIPMRWTASPFSFICELHEFMSMPATVDESREKSNHTNCKE